MQAAQSGGSRARIAVIGGGINGSGIAWELARRDYDVVLFEKGICGAQTSSASTKMIHGGLRYLEHFQFGVVRESLHERKWLLENLPSLVKPLEILLPVYDDSPRSRFTIGVGLTLYDIFAGRKNLQRHHSWTAAKMLARAPLVADGLRGGFSYWDAQVDDFALVRCVVASAAADGAVIRENTRVERLREDGKQWTVITTTDEPAFDLVVNATGPWMTEWLGANDLRARYVMSLIRGSHLVLKRRISDIGALLQSVDDDRVFFVLPWKEKTLVGTTEVVQHESLEDVHASYDEVEYLIARFNHYFRDKIALDDIDHTFAGVRPLVGRATNPSALSRDARVNRQGNLVNVFGGKLTTFMALARKVALRVDNYFGKPRTARRAVFKMSPP